MPIKREKHPVTFRLWPESYRALQRLAAVQDTTRNNVLNRIILALDANVQKMITGGGGDVENYNLICMLPGEFSEAYRQYWLKQLAAKNQPPAPAAESNGASETASSNAA
jgi:hypothetical protein